jgi:hypothetical protein
MLPYFGRERYQTLSHRWLPMAGGDGRIMQPFKGWPLFCFAHF